MKKSAKWEYAQPTPALFSQESDASNRAQEWPYLMRRGQDTAHCSAIAEALCQEAPKRGVGTLGQ